MSENQVKELMIDDLSKMGFDITEQFQAKLAEARKHGDEYKMGAYCDRAFLFLISYLVERWQMDVGTDKHDGIEEVYSKVLRVMDEIEHLIEEGLEY